MYISDRFDVSDTNVKRKRRTIIRNKILKLILFALFLMYPAVSARTAAFFLCRRVNGILYLEADFNLHCLDDRWYEYLGLDITMIFVYPIGIPLFFFFLLYKNRRRLRDPTTVLALGFLYEAYGNDRWWFELCDMAHKLFLTSILIFFPVSAYHAVGMVAILSYTTVILLGGPYVRRIDDRLHLTAQMYLLLIVLVSYILSQSQWEPGSSVDIFASFLCLAVLGLLFALLLYHGFIFIRKFIRNRQRLKQRRNVEFLTENPMFKFDDQQRGSMSQLGSNESVSGNHMQTDSPTMDPKRPMTPSKHMMDDGEEEVTGKSKGLLGMRQNNLSYLHRNANQANDEAIRAQQKSPNENPADIDPNAIPAMNVGS